MPDVVMEATVPERSKVALEGAETLGSFEHKVPGSVAHYEFYRVEDWLYTHLIIGSDQFLHPPKYVVDTPIGLEHVEQGLRLVGAIDDSLPESVKDRIKNIL